MLLLWLATNHGTTANNLNILWAFAPNLIVSFFMFSKKHITWMSNYFIILIVLIILQALVWCFKVEEFSIALIPLFIVLVIRYGYISRYFKR